MAKFYGKIGYGITGETIPGVWVDTIIERDVIGDLIRNTRYMQSAGQVNDNIEINNLLSIVADPYATEHFQSIRYIKDLKTGVAWKVKTVEVQFPRLLLTLGGEYNAQ